MDQKTIAGIGNIYSDEILFQAHVHPTVPVSELDESAVSRLFTSLRSVLEAAVESQALADSNAEGLPHGFLTPVRRPDGACPRCKASIATLKLAGRTSYYCPRCQRLEH